jgi:DNA-binding response OmpR family regulator
MVKGDGTIKFMELSSDKKTILLVEDDTNIRELYAMALVKAGLHIIMAEQGEQGLRLALDKHPDLILLDIDMPVMNGHEVFEKLRLDTWGQTARVIFLTNRDDVRDVAHAKTNKPEDYIVKANLTVKEVVDKVLTAVGQSH